ncbi:hypothetical protein H2200_002750 [Cladophialophora chaetospira]|uniref:AB hydrolase-1 domain-containing protein n=1 Tax=Cladophialophora chaetospira TaxID=386627 RepID=A0AA38XK98_9EURO|nr:hypothetical protein H2200_002750 [Cladophialophora chaetospira]
MAQSSPIILIIPGSFSTAQMYYSVLSSLETLSPNTPAYVSNLPSAIRNAPEPAATLADDAAHFRSIIEKLAEGGREVILVAHSYGGVVATEIAGVSKKEREAQGKKGGVVRIVYLAAHVVEESKSLQEQIGQPPNPAIAKVGEDHFIRFVNVQMIAQGTIPDMDQTIAVEFIKSMGRHSNLSFTSKATHSGWKNVPVSWILTEQDFIVAPDLQKSYIKRIEEESGQKVDLHVLATGHAPNASAPEKVAEVLVKVLALEN